MDYARMTDEELEQMAELVDFADRFLLSPQGALVQKAADRIVERAVAEFALAPSDLLKDTEKLMELKVIIKKYKFGLFEEIKQISREGFLVYQELKNRRPQPLTEDALNSAEKGE